MPRPRAGAGRSLARPARRETAREGTRCARSSRDRRRAGRRQTPGCRRPSQALCREAPSGRAPQWASVRRARRRFGRRLATARAPCGCNRAPATRRARQPRSRRQARPCSGSARASVASGRRRARPASAAASPRRPRWRTHRACASREGRGTARDRAGRRGRERHQGPRWCGPWASSSARRATRGDGRCGRACYPDTRRTARQQARAGARR